MSNTIKIVLGRDGKDLSLSPKIYEAYSKLTGIKFYYYQYDVLSPYRSNEGVITYGKIDKKDALASSDPHFYVSTKDFGDEVVSTNGFYESLFEVTRFKRDDPNLVKVIEEVEDENSNAVIIEIPSDVKWKLEYSETGQEYIAELHREWYANGASNDE